MAIELFIWIYWPSRYPYCIRGRSLDLSGLLYKLCEHGVLNNSWRRDPLSLNLTDRCNTLTISLQNCNEGINESELCKVKITYTLYLTGPFWWRYLPSIRNGSHSSICIIFTRLAFARCTSRWSRACCSVSDLHPRLTLNPWYNIFNQPRCWTAVNLASFMHVVLAVDNEEIRSSHTWLASATPLWRVCEKMYKWS